MRMGAVGFDAIEHVLVGRNREALPMLDLDVYRHELVRGRAQAGRWRR
jgi:hypothetical protein